MTLDAVAIVRPSSWFDQWAPEPKGGVITYDIWDSIYPYSSVKDASNSFSVMRHTPEQAEFIRSTFNKLDALIDVDFEEVSYGYSAGYEDAQIEIYRTYDSDYSLWENASPESVGGGVQGSYRSDRQYVHWRDVSESDSFNIAEKETIVHEIGHALGLNHPHDDGYHSGWDDSDSVMSYNDGGGDALFFTYLDIRALQSIWGVEVDSSIIDGQADGIINTFARNLVDDVLVGSPDFNHNSYDAKFYNLGQGRYGVQQKGESAIDEITGLTSLQFQDQAFSLADDIAATFNKVKGIDDVSGIVFRLYNAAFARLPDAKGLENWIAGNTLGGMTYAISAQEFASSQEFKNRYGENSTDTQYITTLYNNVLERSPDAAGLANYQNLLANGKERGALLLDFSESPENRVLFTEVTGLG